jgi:hypothetical protein
MAAEPFPIPSSKPELDLQAVAPFSPCEVNTYYFQACLDLNLHMVINNYDYLTFPGVRQQVINRLILLHSSLITILARRPGQVVGIALAQLQPIERR